MSHSSSSKAQSDDVEKTRINKNKSTTTDNNSILHSNTKEQGIDNFINIEELIREMRNLIINGEADLNNERLSKIIKILKDSNLTNEQKKEIKELLNLLGDRLNITYIKRGDHFHDLIDTTDTVYKVDQRWFNNKIIKDPTNYLDDFNKKLLPSSYLFQQNSMGDIGSLAENRLLPNFGY